MGWVWSMTATEDASLTVLGNADRATVEFRASSARHRAERTVARRGADPGVTRTAAGDGVAGTLYEPPGSGPHPGVLVLHGSGGTPLDGTAKLLASRGYAALALEYFGAADAVPDELACVPLSHFDAAAAWVRRQPGVRDAPVGVFGRSRGGELALLLGARFGWVGAVVSYVGSGLVWATPEGTPAWTVRGEPVPYVPGPDAPSIEAGYLETVDETLRREATIPVERTDGPVLLVSGGEDPVWPSRRLSALAADRLRDRGFEYDFEHLSYGSAGHYITAPYLPKTAPAFGGTPAGTARADADAWPTALDYLARGLRRPDAGGDGA